MKKTLLLFVVLITATSISAQEKKGKPFFTGTFGTTLAINEDYTLDNDDGETLLEPASVIFRLGIGYQFNRRWSLGLNAGFDHHFRFNINAIPTYVSLRYNITEDLDDTFFIETSYGKMWRPSSRYEDGKYYGLGLGTQIAGGGRWNTILRLDYHRKAITNFENGRLDSVSLSIGFSFF